MSPRRYASLPFLPTALVGRASERALLAQWLAPTPGAVRAHRLVTLTGPPGVGKTSLALAVAHDLADHFRYGIFLGDLAPLDDADAVAQLIAGLFGIRGAGQRSPVEQTTRLLRDRSCLLVLDNFEQVLAAAPTVSALLANCPNLLVLVTSRAPLHLRWELEFPVAPLALPPQTAAPEPDTAPDLAMLAGVASVSLFVERARAVQPQFTLTPENASHVSDICVALDGLPLAIELAAARVRTLPLAELRGSLVQATSVADRPHEQAAGRSGLPPLEILANGPRDLPARQRSVRAAIAWSFALLDAGEQQALRRLAVFVGGATFEAAATVCDASWERVQSLITQNLVHYHPHGSLTGDGDATLAAPDAEPRLRLLETVRQFGLEQLHAHAEWPEMAERHARFFLDLAEQAEPELLGLRQTAWLDRLSADRDNLQAGVRWAADQPDPDLTCRFLAALWRFWWARGDAAESRERIRSALALVEQAPVTPPTPARARALHGAAVLARLLGEYRTALVMFEESRRTADQLGDAYTAAVALNDHGRLAYYQGDYPAARALLEDSLARFQQLGASSGLAATLGSLAQLSYLEGDFSQSRAWSEQGLQIGRQCGDQRALADALHVLGLSHHAEGSTDAARLHYEQCLPIFQALGDRHSIAMTLSGLGGIAALGGDATAARAYYRASLLVAREAANRRRLAITLSAVAALIAPHDALGAARLDAAAALARERLGVRLAAGMQALNDAKLAPALASLNAADRSAAAANGRSLSLEQAVDDALILLAGLASPDAPASLASPGANASLAAAIALVDLPELADDALTVGRTATAGKAPTTTTPPAASPDALTRRERDVVRLLAQGRTTNREIAAALVITEGTAANYVQRVLTRLDLRTRAQVAAWAVEHGLHSVRRPG